MVACSLALVLALATVGVGEDVGRVESLSGVVLGPDGRPLVGAEVLATSGQPDGQGSGLIGRGRSDAEGRFVIHLAEPPSSCDRPMLWVIAGGLVAGSCPLDNRAIDGEPIRIRLEATGDASVVVAGPDGRPIAGAKVIPRTVAREDGQIPDPVAELTSSRTNDAGQAVLSAFRPEELLAVAVEAPGFGTQVREFRRFDGLAGVETKAITLQPCGRVTGRVTAEDPKAVAGLTVRVESSGVRGGAPAGIAEVVTDPTGLFEVPAIAFGPLTVRVRPREGSPDLPARVIRRTLEAGRTLTVEIPLRRGVRVTGVALGDRDGRPIPGVAVSVVPSGSVEPIRVRTDEQGRYEAFVPAGLVSHRVLKVPSPYLCPPSFLGPRPVEVPPAIARFELPAIKLPQGGELRGRVVDSKNQAIPGARVEASWTMIEGRIRAPRSEATTTKADGSFVLHPVAADSELTVSASIGEDSTLKPILARTSDPRPIELKIVDADADRATGQVFAPAGRPIAGASVRIWSFILSPGGSIEAARLVRFDDAVEILTDADGRYQTPGPLRSDREYRAIASAPGFLPGRTRSLRPTRSGPAPFPDLVLAVEGRRVAIEGRVVDRGGKPVEGVEVRASADGPCRRLGTTDSDGRFRLPDVAEGRLFLFAEKEGFRFNGRAIEAVGAPIEFTLTRLDEPGSRSMTTQMISSPGLGLARRVLAPYAERVLTDGDQSTRTRTLELLARVDPKRVLNLIDGRIIDETWLADHLRHAASCSPATEDQADRQAVIAAIHDPEWRVVGELDAADALPDSAKALKREWVERALEDARSIVESSRRVVALARVADRLINLEQTDRAIRLLDEARPIALSLPPATSGGRARVEFAECLARVDPVAALALTDDLVDPGAFDRCRVKIARHLAARDPSHAARVLESLRDPRSLTPAIPALCHALAPVDPAQARRLLARTRNDDPCLAPYALGMMALAIADRDRPTATAWLREAFDQLVRVAAGSGSQRDPAAVAAALLPVAERIDPALVPELFWRAVSLNSPRSGSEIRSDAVFALLLARYDRTVSRAFFDPLADRALTSSETDLAPLIATLAILDPFRAVRLVEELPEPVDLTFHHPKNEARLALTAALLRGTPACWEDATVRFLNLTTETSLD